MNESIKERLMTIFVEYPKPIKSLKDRVITLVNGPFFDSEEEAEYSTYDISYDKFCLEILKYVDNHQIESGITYFSIINKISIEMITNELSKQERLEELEIFKGVVEEVGAI